LVLVHNNRVSIKTDADGGLDDFSSYHPRGADLLFADGSVRFARNITADGPEQRDFRGPWAALPTAGGAGRGIGRPLVALQRVVVSGFGVAASPRAKGALEDLPAFPGDRATRNACPVASRCSGLCRPWGGLATGNAHRCPQFMWRNHEKTWRP
jgi:prepilin-type processing-associated H-X9-DG protein